MKSATLTIRLPSSDLMKIRKIARRFKKSKSDIVREAIEEFIEDWDAYITASQREKEPTITGAELRKRLNISK